MSGHSKWHNIQKKKGAADAKRAGLFTKLAKGITVAAKQGGGDPSFNFSLRMAIDAAKAANMPKDKIEAAIKRGDGSGEPLILDEVVYEGFGPGNVAMLIKCLTDNRNRAIAEVKITTKKLGGNIGSEGSVMWMFDRKGVVAVLDASEIKDRDEFDLAIIEAGAEDIIEEEGGLRIICQVNDLKNCVDAVEKAGVKIDGADIEYLPKNIVSPSPEENDQIEKLIDALDDLDDVDSVYINV